MNLALHTHCGRVAGVSGACNAVGSIMRTVPMNLLFDDIEVIESVGDPASVEVGGISHDSRRVVPGDLFCCVPGHVSDGHAHATEAVERGAVGLLCEHFIPELLDHDVVQTRIARGTMRPVMARLAAAFYGYPARDLLMIGVTGTNGKTTVTQLLGDLLSATGRPTNVMGTLSGARTTPEATEIQRVLAGVRDRQRSDGAAPRRGHGGVEPRPGPITRRGHPLRRRASSPTSATTISITTGPWRSTSRRRRRSSPRATPCAASSTRTIHGADGSSSAPASRWSPCATPTPPTSCSQRGRTEFTWRGQRITTPLTGAVNVDNALLAAEAALALEELQLGPEEIAQAMSKLSPVPGRLQVIAAPSRRDRWPTPGDGDAGDAARAPPSL